MNSSRRGFTIIETVLVLAITGLVAAVILVNVGSSLRNEQYRAAVDQVYDFFQGQYSLSSVIQNDRSGTDVCSSAGFSENAGGTGRGTSRCFIVGRVIKSADGNRIETYAAVALEDVSDKARFPNEESKPPQEVFRDARIVQSKQQSDFRMNDESGVRLTRPGGALAAFTMLIVRSPLTGRVHTYYTDSYQSAVSVQSMTVQDVTFCVAPFGLINAGIQPSGLRIGSDAANSSAVQPLGSGECV